jgi:hypothetical protein
VRQVTMRTKYHLLVFVTWPVGTLAIGLLAARVWGYLAPLAFLWAIWVHFRAREIRCPRCEKPIGWTEYFSEFWAWSPVARRHCEKCGYDLNVAAGG